ncbi:MAG: hypothetical protein JHC26_12825 [Thermofilum sp.]|nr:hypothetical protein [Thermofilum sp.]
MLERPIFFSIRKNSSFLSWRPYNDFFNFTNLCIDIISEEEFVIYEGQCISVQRLGQKSLVPASKYRRLRNGIYILVEEKDGRYIFRFTKPLQSKT